MGASEKKKRQANDYQALKKDQPQEKMTLPHMHQQLSEKVRTGVRENCIFHTGTSVL